MLWQRMLLNPLPIVTKQIPVLGVSATGRMIKRLLVVLPMLVLPHLVVAQETSSWIGQKVVTKYELLDYKLGISSCRHMDSHVYTVQRIQRRLAVGSLGQREGLDSGEPGRAVRSSYRLLHSGDYSNPGNSVAWRQRGLIWNEKKDYDKAIADFNEAIRLDPKLALAYNNRGNAWDAKKEYDKAIADFNEAIRLDPKLALAYNNRGTAWMAKKDYDKAIADYNEAIRLDPKHAPRTTTGALAWHDKKDYDKAIADYNEAIRLDPKLALAYNNRGNAWRTRRSTTRRSPTTTRQSGSIPRMPSPTTTEASLGGKKDFDKAIADCNEAIRLDPKYALAYNNRGNAWHDKKNYDKAIADYNEAIRLDPTYAFAYNNRGDAWYDKKDYDKAIADFNEAIRLDPKLALPTTTGRLRKGTELPIAPQSR